MPHSSPKFILEQIYNFIAEMPYIDSKSQFMQLNIFFRELHESDVVEFEAVKPSSYRGVYNDKKKVISAHLAPNFLNKEKFLNWAIKAIED